MAKYTILVNTFEAATADAADVGEFFASRINGTVLVEDGAKNLTAWAIKNEDGSINALGFIGRYPTGTKNWRVCFVANTTVQSAYFGNDDRSGRCNKQRGISFNPDAFFAIK